VTGPNAAALQLGKRLDQLHQIIEQLREAEAESIAKRLLADVEESKEYLKAQGSIEARKHEARVACERLEFAALTAEAQVRHLMRLMKEAQLRVDAGRTYSADLRAELAVLGRDGAT
jgi:transcriptional regulator of NAD metabolism